MDDSAENGAQAPVHDQKPGRTALLIIDMINCFDFSGSEALKPKAECAARAILRLKAQMRDADYPVIYVNDNFGEWHSERTRLIERASSQAGAIVQMIKPEPDDYFIIKPQFSGFYSTNLPVLLPKLGVSRLILTGIATDICVMFTAADAHMRDYTLWIPEDTVATVSDDRGQFALQTMRDAMGAVITSSANLDFKDWMICVDRESELHGRT